MDSITQMALGAAVGEAALGKQAGGKAALWGGVLGTLPDLDVLAYPLLSPAGELAFHRGPTHALTFSFVAAPLFGMLLDRIHRKDEIGRRRWTWLAFLALITHPLLDAFTAYGTQLLLPFSDLPVAWNTISIIDPLYTIPLLIGVLWAQFVRKRERMRASVIYGGLAVSSLYLSLTVANKLHVSSIIEEQLAHSKIRYDRVEVMPMLFSNLLWLGLADDGEMIHAGLYSLADDDKHIRFRAISKNGHLLPDEPGEDIRVLLWFSRGLYCLEEEDGAVFFNDLHVGRTDFFMTEDGESIFRFRIVPDGSGELTFEAMEPGFENRARLLDAFWRRIWGDESVVEWSDVHRRRRPPVAKTESAPEASASAAVRVR